MNKQNEIIRDFFNNIQTVNGITVENIETENSICCYRWQLTTDKENSVWELKQLPQHIVITALSLKFEKLPSEKIIPLLNRMNYYNHKGTFFLGIKGDIYLESSNFYRNHFYIEEELALFITEMIDHLSLFYLFGENCLKNNIEMEEALKTSIEFRKTKKN
jgi:hypothetical protein